LHCTLQRLKLTCLHDVLMLNGLLLQAINETLWQCSKTESNAFGGNRLGAVWLCTPVGVQVDPSLIIDEPERNNWNHISIYLFMMMILNQIHL
jgi:hypothetical protein